MQKSPNKIYRIHSVRAAVAGLVCVLILFCGALAANSQWHHWWHNEGAPGEDHAGCAVCLLAAGGCDYVPTDPGQLLIPLIAVLEAPLPDSPWLPVGFRPDFGGRGPPVARA